MDTRIINIHVPLSKKVVLIIGAGPAGLTAAYELLKQSDIYHPIIVEASSDIGGISKTVNYKGNRIDVGGHRFFSKSEVVMKWWADLMPIEEINQDSGQINRMMIRNRVSRIFYLRKFFDYPISLSPNTLKNLGCIRILKIAFSYIFQKAFPIKKIEHLEHFFISRFGKVLYKIFFKDYTEKVWGVPCAQICPIWGVQRIKGLSITKTISHALMQIVKSEKSISQKGTETSLIERFLYPKLGPGQLWEDVADKIIKMGGEIHLNSKVVSICLDSKSTGLTVSNPISGGEKEYLGNYILSTMPIKDLCNSIDKTASIPKNILNISQGLIYRDFITVGLLLNKLKIENHPNTNIKDQWIYIQDSDVKIARLQIFNNWSPFMVKDPSTYWIGLEFFCYETDDFWKKADDEIIGQGIDELIKLGIIDEKEIIDQTIVKMPKAYPSYTGTYSAFGDLKDYLNSFEQLFLMGRNGLHRYNNADHSILTAMHVVDFLLGKKTNKNAVWDVNANPEYLEEK